MTSTSDIAAKFAAVIAAFTPIVAPPTNDLRNIRMILLKLCMSIDLAGSTPSKVTGLILVGAV